MRSIHRNCALALCVCTFSSALSARAESREFDFKDPKGVNAMSFVLDSLVEPIIGVASGISGTLSFDSSNVEATHGTITVDAASLDMPHKRMATVMHGKDWLNVAEHPTIEFIFKKVKSTAPVQKGVYTLDITGDFTCHGITREMTISASVTHLPGKLPERMHRGKGDLLVLRSQFSIKRSDFEINPSTPATVVADEIELRVSIVGLSPQ